MNGKMKIKNEEFINPQVKAGILSNLLFLWFIKAYKKFVKQPLSLVNLFDVLKKYSASYLSKELEENWQNELALTYRQPSLIKAVKKTYIIEFICHDLLLALYLIIVRPMQVIVLSSFIATFSNVQPLDLLTKSITASIIILILLITVFGNHLISYYLSLSGMKLRIGLSSLVYKKVVKLNVSSINDTKIKQIFELLSSEVYKFDNFFLYIHHVWLAPLQTLVFIILMFRHVGVGSFVGVGFLLCIVIPLQGYIANSFSKLRLKTLRKRNLRMHLISNIIKGMRTIKMNAWEKPFKKLIESSLKEESHYGSMALFLIGLNFNWIAIVDKIPLFLTIISNFVLSDFMSIINVFTLAMYFNIMRQAIMINFPRGIVHMMDGLFSLKKIESFLQVEEVKGCVCSNCSLKEVVISELFLPIPKNENSSLTAISINFLKIYSNNVYIFTRAGELEKKLLISLFLDEAAPTSGAIHLNGDIAYCSATPWLFKGSIEENVIFNEVYSYVKYKNVISICGLEEDIKKLPYESHTLVDEVALTTKQKAMIHLARTIYKTVDIYLIVDPVHFTWEMRDYLKHKTVILFTDNEDFFQFADKIVVFKDGKIDIQGSYVDLKTIKYNFLERSAEFKELDSLEESIEKHFSKSTIVSHKLSIDNEEKQSMSLRKVLWKYLKFGGSTGYVIFVVFFAFLTQLSINGSDLLNALWSLDRKHYVKDKISFDETNSTIVAEDENTMLIGMYLYISTVVLAILLTILRSIITHKLVRKASKKIQTNLINTLLNLPIDYFENHKKRYVLNRFSKDLQTVDTNLPISLLEFSQIILLILGAFGLIIFVNAYICVIIYIVALIYLKVQWKFIQVYQEIKNVENMAKTHYYTFLKSTAFGLPTIKYNNGGPLFQVLFNQNLDIFTSANFLSISCAYSFGLWLDLISILFFSADVFVFISMDEYVKKFEQGYIGLAMSQALVLSVMLQNVMGRSLDSLNCLSSMKNILDFIENPQEDKGIDNCYKWPTIGEIKFENVSIKGCSIFKETSFIIPGGKKIGVVFAQQFHYDAFINLLYNFVEFEGTIAIDGINTKLLTLNELRKNISFIPDLHTFSNSSVRFFIDPCNEFKDDEIWNVLKQVNLNDIVINLDANEIGNYSNYDKQLFCVARAILKRSKIILVNENYPYAQAEIFYKKLRLYLPDSAIYLLTNQLTSILETDLVLSLQDDKIAFPKHAYLHFKEDESLLKKMLFSKSTETAQNYLQTAYKDYIKKLEI